MASTIAVLRAAVSKPADTSSVKPASVRGSEMVMNDAANVRSYQSFTGALAIDAVTTANCSSVVNKSKNSSEVKRGGGVNAGGA